MVATYKTNEIDGASLKLSRKFGHLNRTAVRGFAESFNHLSGMRMGQVFNRSIFICASVVAPTLIPSLALAQKPTAVMAGSYECWAYQTPRMLMNFKITGTSTYSNPDGSKKGNFTFSPANGAIAFKGGHLDGIMPDGFTSVYHEPNKMPTVSFRGRSGFEAQFCQRVNR